MPQVIPTFRRWLRLGLQVPTPPLSLEHIGFGASLGIGGGLSLSSIGGSAPSCCLHFLSGKPPELSALSINHHHLHAALLHRAPQIASVPSEVSFKMHGIHLTIEI